MELLPYPIAVALAAFFISLLGIVLFLNVFGLPANWIIIGLVALWQYLHFGRASMGLWYWVIVFAIAVTGELLEFGLQIIKARHYGSSSQGTFAGMIGAIAGAIFLAPLFWGIGAFIGALAGAWIGCLVMELCRGMPAPKAFDAAFGTMMGRFLGTVCKVGLGAVIIAITCQRIWPEMPPEPPLQDIIQAPAMDICLQI